MKYNTLSILKSSNTCIKMKWNTIHQNQVYNTYMDTDQKKINQKSNGIHLYSNGTQSKLQKLSNI